jgi:glycosyltransferase involved in cell wall biosynthesis
MKILVLCYEYPPIGGGGGRVTAQVAKELARRGHEVRVITAGMPHLPRQFNDEGIEVYRERSFRRREDTCTVPEMGLYLLTNFLPSLRQARDWKPDVIHAHFAVPTGVLALALHLFTRKPYVITAHLGDVPGGVPEQTEGLFRLVNPFVRPVWRQCARVTAVSTFVGNLARKAYQVDPEVILNAVRMSRAAEVHPNQPPV